MQHGLEVSKKYISRLKYLVSSRLSRDLHLLPIADLASVYRIAIIIRIFLGLHHARFLLIIHTLTVVA